MADADPHAPIVVADCLGDGAQAVVAGISAAAFDAHFGRREIEFVVKDDDVVRRELIEMRRLLDGAARTRSCRFRASARITFTP